MTKHVLITMTSRQFEQGEEMDQPILTTVPGEYERREELHCISYTEQNEAGKSEVEIYFNTRRFEVHKAGDIQFDLLLAPNQKSTSVYQTPFGQMITEMFMTDLEVREGEEELYVSASYSVSMNQAPPYDCEIILEIVPGKKAV